MPQAQTAIFLSPHFDDIALSCGGMAARLAKSGAQCIGITVFAAPAHEDDVLSPFAAGMHQLWESGAGQKMSAINDVRREEEKSALHLLGLQPAWLQFQDAPYRRGTDGRHLYNSDPELFGKLSTEERKVLVPQITAEIQRVAHEAGARGRVRIFAPLGIGNHVDHQLVFHAARRLGPRYGVLFYEDYPYAGQQGALGHRLQSLGVTPEHQGEAHSPSHTASARSVPISDVLGVKIAAIARYKSQLGVLFGSNEAMPPAVRAYAQAVTGGDNESFYIERFWQLPSLWTLI